jgi:hypothetical protein
MIFETKKIQMETLGEYLSAVRQNLGLDIEEVAAKTNIKPKFLRDLETGNFASLPPPVYVQGFLKELSLLYRLELEVLIKQYKKEINILQQVGKRQNEKILGIRGYFKNIIITPKFISLSVGVAFVLLTIIYIIWQVLSINRTPGLEIFEPTDRQVISESFVNIRGKTDPGMILTVNDQNIFVDSEGNFKSQLGLATGLTELTFTAKNKFDKEVTKIISVNGENKASSTVSQEMLQLKLEFFAEVILTFAADNGSIQTQTFHEGEVKVFTAAKKIVISTSDAGATRATLNGQVVGMLGRPQEQLANISFFAPENSQ